MKSQVMPICPRKKRRRIIRRPEHKSSMTEQASWQHREEPDRELSEVENIDVPVAVEIEGGDESSLSRAQVERRRKETKVGYVHVPVAVDVAEEAEQALRLAKHVVAA